jgi:hypothetical protein
MWQTFEDWGSMSMRCGLLRWFKCQCLWFHAQLVSLSRYKFFLFPLNSLATSSKMLMWYILNKYFTMDWKYRKSDHCAGPHRLLLMHYCADSVPG